MGNLDLLGYVGAILAGVFFGSNYIPTKNYPMGDGFGFVWVFSSGVMTVAFISVFINGGATFAFSGLIGGALWATGNLCVIPIVKMIGLGLGMLLWGCSSLITGYFFGKFGLAGLQQDTTEHPALNWGGIVCIIIAMVIFFFIKPTLEPKEVNEERKHLLNQHESDYSDGTVKEEKNFFENLPAGVRLPVGVLLAVGSGMFYGVNIVPIKLLTQQYHKDHNGEDPKPLAYVLSHFSGIYLFNTVVFLVYCISKIINKRPVQIFPQSILPSFISGAMWGIAQCGLMMATAILGFTVGFPIGSTGPVIVSSLWSVLYFSEIRGTKNISLLIVSMSMLITGIVLLALSGRK